MAPEIVNKTEYCGPPADVWALGVLLFTCISGCFPYRGATDSQLYAKITAAALFKIFITNVSNENGYYRE